MWSESGLESGNSGYRRMGRGREGLSIDSCWRGGKKLEQVGRGC